MGFRWEAYVNTDEYEGYAYCPNMFYIEELLKEKRCPIIKRRSFFTDYSDFLLNSCGEVSVEAFEYMRDQLDYPEDEIWDNLLSTGKYERHTQGSAFKLCSAGKGDIIVHRKNKKLQFSCWWNGAEEQNGIEDF